MRSQSMKVSEDVGLVLSVCSCMLIYYFIAEMHSATYLFPQVLSIVVETVLYKCNVSHWVECCSFYILLYFPVLCS